VTALSAPTDNAPRGGHRALFLVILASLGMIGPFSIDTMFPAFARMGAEFGANELALQQIISSYMLTFAVMSLVHGPLSDALGRKPMVVAGTVIYIGASIGCALAPNLGVLLAFRAVQGLSAGAGAIISRAMVRDVYADAQARRTMSHIAMIFGLAPALAPVVGGLLLGFGGWRIIFWFLVAVGVAMLALVVFFLPETHPAERRTPVNVRHLAAGLWSVARTPSGRRLSLAAMFNNGAMFLYVSSAPLLVGNLLRLGEQDYWKLFVPLISGMVIGSWVSGRLAGRLSGTRVANLGYLISLSAGALNLGMTLIPGTGTLPWAVALLPVLTFGIALTFPVITLAMLDLFPAARGSASSVQNFVALLGNTLVSGLLAPALGFSLTALAAGSFGYTIIGALLWRRHLTTTALEPPTSPDAAAFEPLE
jgi:DHA1 family bicyclomycin/chloramphenicol resistance-like MFS transporter